MTSAQALQWLERWRAAGALHALDLAFARWLLELDPAAAGSLLLAGAMVAALEGEGHAGLPLADDAGAEVAPAGVGGPSAGEGAAPEPAGGTDAAGWMLAGWPPALRAELAPLAAAWPRDAAVAAASWNHPLIVERDPADDQGSTPLVWVSGPGTARLALRRYWRDERSVAAQVRLRSSAPIDAATDAATGAVADEDAGAVAVGPAADGLRQAWLERLFPASAVGPDTAPEPLHAGAALMPGAAAGLDRQRQACLAALDGRFTVITGGPGTGKTYTAARLLVLLRALHRGPRPLRVALAAPTGKAASRLRESIDAALDGLDRELGQPADAAAWPAHAADVLRAARAGAAARTLHAWLGLGTRGDRPGIRARTLQIDVMLVDEASMVHLGLMAELLRVLPPQARLVLLGDRDQLASVEAGAVLADLCEAAAPPGGTDARSLEVPDGALGARVVALQASRRFGGAIGELARVVHAGDGAAVRAVFASAARGEGLGAGVLALHVPADPAAMLAQLRIDGWAPASAGGWAAFVDGLRERPRDPAQFAGWVRMLLARADHFRVLCALRSGPWGAQGCNAALDAALRRAGLPAPQGRLAMVTRNHPALEVYNGDIGLVLQPPDGGALRLYLSGERSVALSRLPDLDSAWALTVHKSQGSEFAHVALVLPPHDSPLLTRELLYTGITRARERITLIAPEPALIATACARRTRRLGGLRALLAGGGVS